jgi:hypothetical protein
VSLDFEFHWGWRDHLQRDDSQAGELAALKAIVFRLAQLITREDTSECGRPLSASPSRRISGGPLGAPKNSGELSTTNGPNNRYTNVRAQFSLRSFGHQKYAPLAVIPDST